MIRLPIFAVTTIALPLMFYVIFGITFAGEQARGVGMTTYMLVTYGAFGVIGAALFGSGCRWPWSVGRAGCASRGSRRCRRWPTSSARWS